MKKNRMMRLASVLLVLTLLTTSMISGTFAKYTTSVSSEDTARVAKWGFEATTMDITGLFSNAYTSDSDDVDGNTVFSASSDLIAPGTKNSVNFSFAYDETSNGGIQAPEVDYEFTVKATATGEYAALDANPTFKWTLKAPGAGSETKAYDTVADLLAAINALDGATGESGVKYKAGYLPTSFYGSEATETAAYTLGWEWAFEDTGKTAAQDETDTAMGNADNLNNITISITITATQVD